MVPTAELQVRLQQIVRRGRVLTSPAQLAGYDADGLGYKTFPPDAVAIPADADELIQLLGHARELNVPVTVRGAGTSLSGGPVAAQGGVVIHTSSLKKIRSICREGFWCEVESSVVLNTLDAVLQPYGLFYPPDPSSGPVCTLGGNVAMNAGGAHCFRYGVTSNYVLGVEAVLLDGTVRQFGGPAGGRGSWRDDWKRLMVGSEGTLAAFTRFWLRLLPRPEKAWTYRATFPDLKSAERAIHALSAHVSFPVAIELMDPRCVAMVENSPMAVGLPRNAFLLVTEIDGPAVLVDARAAAVAELIRSAGAADVEYSDNEDQRKRLWRARKVAGGLMGQISPDFLVQDAVIPKRALAEVLQFVYDEADAAGFPVVNVFHAGDGNLHPNFLFDSASPGELEKVEAISKRLMQRVVEVGGTLSGEHGIGNDKTAYMPLVFDSTTLRLQLAVPRIFNPQHQLNPRKVFAARDFDRRKIPLSARREAVSIPQQCESVKAVSTDTGTEHLADSGHRSNSRCELQTHANRGPFEPFMDRVDSVMCVPAQTTGAELQCLCREHRLRFPLLLDQRSSLAQQIASSEYAPSSSRFGGWCDNIPGINWKLPGGRVVRIGERVVKSTTGYDLLRFLLHSDGRYGEPVDFVLRLRPDCGTTTIFRLAGEFPSVAGAASEITATPWLHWFDSVDVILERQDQPVLRVVLNCPSAECRVFEDRLRLLAAAHQLTLTQNTQVDVPDDGCPDVMLKTTPDRSLSLAAELSADEALRLVVLPYCGVIHLYDPNTDAHPDQRMAQLIGRYQAELEAAGGDLRSRHRLRRSCPEAEQAWSGILETEFAAP